MDDAPDNPESPEPAEPFDFLDLPLLAQEEILANVGLIERARICQTSKYMHHMIEQHGCLPEKMIRAHVEARADELRVSLYDEYRDRYIAILDKNSFKFKMGLESTKVWEDKPSYETANRMLKHVRPRFTYFTNYVDDMPPEPLTKFDLVRQSICVSLSFICLGSLLERMRERGFYKTEVLNFVWIRNGRSCFNTAPCKDCVGGYEQLLEYLPQCRKIYLRSRVEIDEGPVVLGPRFMCPWKPTEDSILNILLLRKKEVLFQPKPRLVAIDLENCDIEGLFRIIEKLEFVGDPVYSKEENMYIYVLCRSTYGYNAFIIIQNFELCYIGHHYLNYEHMLSELRDTNRRYPVVCRPK
ncbi:unnamed protein product, partial [Mesorhabditis spiculigera]